LRKILYLVKDPNPVRTDLLVSDQTSGREVSVVLLQDGVSVTDLPTNRVYALSDGLRSFCNEAIAMREMKPCRLPGRTGSGSGYEAIAG
jgi:hypothetical protein